MTRFEAWKEKKLKEIQEKTIDKLTEEIVYDENISCEDCCVNYNNAIEDCESDSCECKKYIKQYLEQEE